MPDSGSSRSYIVQAVLALVVVFLLVAFGRMRTEMRQMQEENARLREQTSRVSDSPAEAAAPLAQPPGETAAQAPVAAAEPDVAAQNQAPMIQPPDGLVSTPTGFAPPPRGTGLTLAGTHAAPVAGGLRATMRFNPTTEDALGIVAVVVRLPLDGGSRILELAPQGDVQYADVSTRVAENGKFAIFQGTPAQVKALEFSLTVTEPTTADVRGTAGIGPLNLRIGSDGASATP